MYLPCSKRRKTMGKSNYLLLGMALLGLSSCVTGQNTGSAVGMQQAELVAQRGQPQQIIDDPAGGKVLVYETSRMDQMAIMGAGAWGKPEQIYYWLDAQGNVTKVDYYPYGKRKFLFPTEQKPAKLAASPTPAVVAQAQTPPPLPPQEELKQPPQTEPSVVKSAPALPPASPAPAPPKATPIAVKPTPPAPGPKGMGEAARLEHGMSKEDVTRLLGLPDRTEGFRVDGKGVVVWSYKLADQTGHRVPTPLIFENNRLAGWGDAYYQMVLKKAGAQPR
jgi:Protein of unknown function (DUF3192)